jgi:hypothetical protein
MPAKKAKPAAKKVKAPAKKVKAAAPKTKPALKKAASALKKAAPKKAVIKTVETNSSVEQFINTVADEQKRKDSFVLAEMMKKATGAQPKMWGSAIIGFGNKLYVSPNTGRAVDWFIVGFSPRKANLTLYLTVGINHFPAELKKLGKHKTSGGCLYINKLSDVDTKVLEGMITAAAKKNKK